MIDHKTCIDCNQSKPRTSEHFRASKKCERQYLSKSCKDCMKALGPKRPKLPPGEADHRARERRKRLSKYYRESGPKPGISDVKVCPMCAVGKPRTAEFFTRNRGTRDGLTAYCKTCWRTYGKKTPKEKKAEMQRARRNKNREAFNAAARQRRIDNPSLERERGRAYQKRWKDKNPWNRARHAMSTCVTRSIRTGKYDSWQTIVGYTLADLRAHLEAQFEPGMTWENYGRYGWHIGHRRPVSWFSFETAQDPDFAKCWALSNLFPQWARENQGAGNRRSFELPLPEHQSPSQGGPSVLECAGQSHPETCS